LNLSFFTLNFLSSLNYDRLPFIFEGRIISGVSAIVSSRAAGNMLYSGGKDGPARLALFRFLGLEPSLVYACTQVHSREALEVSRQSPNTGPRVDGLISRDKALTLSVTAADCLPVFLYDTEKEGLALVHSGWKGTSIVLSALEMMEKRWRTRPEDVAAVFGPCIRRCCYNVDQGRAGAFAAEFGGPGGTFPLGPVVSESGGEFFLDLQAANARLLAGAGVRNISVCENCTFTDERLGSFRREGPLAYTKMAALTGFF
jgi:YfiH family protein